MGLFSSKKKHFVDTSVVRVVEDELVPNVLLTATVESVLKDTRVTETVLDQALHGNFRKVERLYRHARDGNYVYGLPNATVLGSQDGVPLAKQELEYQLGRSVTIDYLFYRPLNNFHAGWKALTEDCGYNHETNEATVLSAQKGWPVYLDKMVAVHQTEAGLEPEYTALGNLGQSTQSGQTPTRPAQEGSRGLRFLVVEEEARSGATETESVELHFVWEEVIEPTEAELETDPTATTEYVLHEEMVVIDLSGFDGDTEFYQAKYRYMDGAEEVIGYWTYDPALAPDSPLNRVFQTSYINPGSYFPFVIFRRERENQASQDKVGTPAYESTAALLRKIDMDFQTIADTIHENEDIDSIEQAVMMWAVPITTDNEIQIAYLHKYFKRLADQLPPGFESDRLARRLTHAPEASYAIKIQDADFSTVISFDGIKVRLKARTIGPVGTYRNELKQVELSINPGNIFELGGTGLSSTQHDVRVISKQITTGVCEEIEITNPMIRYDIFRDKGVEGGNSDDRLLIPLDYELCKTFSPIDREDLYFRSQVFVFNSRVTQKVKWYQSGIFKAIITIVGIAITVFSLGTDGGLGATLAAAAAAGGTVLAVTLLKITFQYLLVNILMDVAFTFVARAIGTDIAFYLAVAAALYGGYKVVQAGMKLTPSAQNLLMASSGLSQGAGNVLREEFGDLQEDWLRTQEEQQDLWEELEQTRDVLGLNRSVISIDPLRYVNRPQPLVVFGEPPEVYYERTVHAGNVGVSSLAYIENYVGNALRLPTMAETTQEMLA